MTTNTDTIDDTTELDTSEDRTDTTEEDVVGEPVTADPEPPAEDHHTTRVEDSGDQLELFDHYRHRSNGDETIVVLSSFGRGYQALAFDVDKSGEILATEAIGDAEDRASAESMCTYWLKQNPKGILGTTTDDDAGGFLEKLGFGGGGGGGA